MNGSGMTTLLPRHLLLLSQQMGMMTTRLMSRKKSLKNRTAMTKKSLVHVVVDGAVAVGAGVEVAGVVEMKSRQPSLQKTAATMMTTISPISCSKKIPKTS